MKRRLFITSAAGVAMAGCSATQQEFEFESTPGEFADDAVSDAGYERLEREEVVETRTVEAAGEERDVTVTNYAQPYRRQVQLGGENRTLGAAVVFTTPSISFFGQEYNPVGSMSPREIVDFARGRMSENVDGGDITGLSKQREETRTVLDTETTVGVFEAVTELDDGIELTLELWITRVKHDGDFVLVGGAFPRPLRDSERPKLETLFDNVEHDGE